MTEQPGVSQVEDIEDFGPGDEGERARWLAEIDNAENNDQTKQWRELGKKIVKRYRDDREKEDSARRFSALYSNVETLKPVLLSKLPEPYAERRYGDKDPVARAASMILERGVRAVIDTTDFIGPIKAARDDRLLVGRGQVWLRLENVTEGEGDDERVTEQTVAVDYVPFDEFLHSPAPKWTQVTWVARKLMLAKAKVREVFGEEVAGEIDFEAKVEGASDEDVKQHPDVFLRAVIWEIWDKTSRKVIWVSDGYSKSPLKKADMPMAYRGGFPCPQPLYGITTNETLVPIPDFREYEGQAAELDELSIRIDLVTSAIAVRGAYNSKFGALMSLITAKAENKLVAVDDWASFAQSGGFDGNIAFLPTEKLVQVLASLYEARARVKAEMDEITGIADVIRGASVASETATAQRIKSQYASLRLKEHQDTMARFVRDIMEMVGEIVVEAFDPEFLKKMVGSEFMSEFEVEQPSPDPNAPPVKRQVTVDEALALLKNEGMRTYRINFETDALVASEKEMQQKRAVEMLGAVTPYMEKGVMLGQQVPEIAPMVGEMLLWLVRQFGAGRELESTVERTMENMQNAPKDKGPSEAEIEAKAKMDLAQMQAQADLAMVQAKGQNDLQLEQMRSQIKAQSEVEKATILGRVQADAELAKESARAQAESAREQARVEIERIKAQAAVEAQRFTQELEARKLALAEEEARHRAKIESAKLVLDAAKSGIDPTNAVAPDVQAQAMQALSETMAPLASLADLPNALKSMAAGMAEMARAQGAEKEVLRDPTGRAVGVRIKAAKVLQ